MLTLHNFFDPPQPHGYSPGRIELNQEHILVFPWKNRIEPRTYFLIRMGGDGVGVGDRVRLSGRGLDLAFSLN